MRNIKNNARSIDYKIENRFILKLKEKIRDFRQRKLFYLEHSKFATYVPPEYLSVFKEEIIEFSKAWIRMQQKNMSSEKKPGIEGHASTRGLHVMDTATNAEMAAEELLLNGDLAYVGGLIHDIAHTGFAHEGEKYLSEYLQKEGICEIHHSSLARLMLEIERIHEKVIERIEEKKGRPLTQKELKEYRKAYLSISDIAVCHNGEGHQTEVRTNREKTNEDVEEEYINTFVKKGLDRRTRNRTKEGALVLFCDPISYVAKDFRDGIIKGLIDVNDSAFEDVFIKLGLTKQELDRWTSEGGKKDKIVKKITRILRDNLVENSRGIDGARMSEETAKNMYDLRQLNYDKVVKPGLRKIYDILPQRIEALIDRYSDLLLEYESGEFDESIQLDKYKHKMLQKFTTKKSSVVEDIYDKIARRGIEENVRNEVQAVIDKRDEPKTERHRRFEKDIAALKLEGEISENVREAYIQRVLKEIALSPKESRKMLTSRLAIEYEETDKDKLEQLANEHEYLRLKTYSECLAKLKVAIYIGESSNDYLLDMLEEENLITPAERKNRYVSGGDTKNSALDKAKKEQEEDLLK